MRWIEAAFPTRSEEIDGLCERLAELGADGLIVEDEADFRRFVAENRQYWDSVDEALERRYAGVSRVKLYVADDAEGRAKLARFTEALGREPQTRSVRDEDWENNWKAYYRPIEIGQRLVVVPEWEPVPAGGRLALRLDPGLIFGTGSHPTTRLCLEALETLPLAGQRALDLGCGSGILAIGALLLGCASAAGCDVDPKAPDVALANAALNGIGPERFRVLAGDILKDAGLRADLGGGYGLVLANIVADVIIPLASLAPAFLAPEGVFVCSGIIEGRQDETERALERAGLRVTERRTLSGWWRFTARRA